MACSGTFPETESRSSFKIRASGLMQIAVCVCVDRSGLQIGPLGRLVGLGVLKRRDSNHNNNAISTAIIIIKVVAKW